MTTSLSPCVINPGVVTGTTNKIEPKRISYQDTKARIQVHEHDIYQDVKKNSYKNKEKTPTFVKVIGGIALFAGVVAYIKNKIKK